MAIFSLSVRGQTSTSTPGIFGKLRSSRVMTRCPAVTAVAAIKRISLSNANPPRSQVGPQAGVDARHSEIERQDAYSRQDFLYEGLPLRSLSRARAVHAVEQLGCADGRQRDVLTGVLLETPPEVAVALLGADEDARVDQRSHGSPRGVLSCLAPSSCSSRK